MGVRAGNAILVCLAAASLLAAPVAAQPQDLSIGEPLPEAPHVSGEPPPEEVVLFEDDWLEEEEAPDPLEVSNRVVFGANDLVYRWVLDPVADVYEFAVPGLLRRSLRRFFANLREPANFVNELIQLRGCQAGKTGARFLVNSTVGIGGLLDPAEVWGLEPYNTDFGQTLGYYGVGDGFYLVLPLIGPANLRDAVGQLVDASMRPDLWLLASGPQLVFVTSDGISGYESRRIYLEELRENSFDFYAAMRSAYRMDRDGQIREMHGDGLLAAEPAMDPEPEADTGPEAAAEPEAATSPVPASQMPVDGLGAEPSL